MTTTDPTNQALYTLTMAKVDELVELVVSGNLSPENAAVAINEFANGDNISITPRHRELFEQRQREELVNQAIAQAINTPPMPRIEMNIRRVYPD